MRQIGMVSGAVLAFTAVAAGAQETPAAQVEAQADDLESRFRDPPPSARPRVWWHWMNGNVTQEGIAKDLAWMKRIGIGGVQNFDASLQTPKVVENRLAWMTPEWKAAFRFATAEAERLGLEFAIASSPGWSETGGPWVPPQDGMKKLVWSETEAAAGSQVGKLPALPGVTGPFQSYAKPADIAAPPSGKAVAPPRYSADAVVLAVPLGDVEVPPASLFYDGAGNEVDGSALLDDDPAGALGLKRGDDGGPARLTRVFAAPATMQAATVHVENPMGELLGKIHKAALEASDDGTVWKVVAEISLDSVPTTVSFAPVKARYFRVGVTTLPVPAAGDRDAAPGVATPDWRTMLGNAIGKQPVRLAAFKLHSGPRVDRFEAKAGFSIAADYLALPAGLPDADAPAPEAVLDLTDRLKADGTLDWTPPEGRWQVFRFGWSLVGKTNHPASAEATGLEVDKYDRDAVRRYLERYLAMYADALGSPVSANGAIDALLTDSIEVGPSNWTPLMVSEFRKRRGYDPRPWLPALAGTIIGSRARSDQFLFDFRRTLADLLASEHYGTIAKVAHENGLAVYGEATESGRPVLGSDIAMRSHADIPMAAMWTHSRERGPAGSHVADIRGAASVAGIYGRNLVAAESLTSAQAPWAHAPQDLKRIIDLEFVLGVNRPVIHTSVHQPVEDKVPGLSLFYFGQFFNRHETWAELARPWVDYLARNSLLLQQGRRVADVAYFSGEDAPLTALYAEGPPADLPRRYGSDFVDADVVLRELANDGADIVTAGGARYRALYLGSASRAMTLPVLRRIEELAEGGATIIGRPPREDPALARDDVGYVSVVARLWPGNGQARIGKGRVINSSDPDAALAAAGVAPDFRYADWSRGSDVAFLHRRIEAGADMDTGGDIWFLVNRLDRPERIEARFRISGKVPELWHADTGEIEPVSYRISGEETIVPLQLAAEGAVHVVFRKPVGRAARTVRPSVRTQLARLDGPWAVRFQPGRGAPAFAVLPELVPLDGQEEPGIRHFSGIATYEKVFSPPAAWKPGAPLWLDLGEVREVAEVVLNGQAVGTAWHAPFRIDIAPAVVPGLNKLEVRVANLWVNRLVGDAQEGVQKLTWTATTAYKSDAPLRRSGLIGPVRLLAGD